MTNAAVARSRAAQLRQSKNDAAGWAAVRVRRAEAMFEIVNMVSRNGNRVDRCHSLQLYIARDKGLLLILDAGEWGYEVELTESALDVM
jgi:hypothetical protein